MVHGTVLHLYECEELIKVDNAIPIRVEEREHGLDALRRHEYLEIAQAVPQLSVRELSEGGEGRRVRGGGA